MNKYEGAGLITLLVVAMWVFLMGWVIPLAIKISSTALLFATFTMTIIAAYASVKALVITYKNLNQNLTKKESNV